MKYYSEFKIVVSAMGLENADVIYRHYRAWEKGFCKDKECAPEKSIRLYVQNHLPTNAMKAIADLPGNESNRMLRWLKEMKIPVIDTLKGYCVSKQDFSAIHAVLAREKPVYPVFKAMCEWANIPYTYAEYHSFVRMHRDIIAKYRYHPIYCGEEYFYDATSPVLEKQLKRWSMLRTADYPCTVKGYCSLAVMAEMCGTTPEKLVDWLMQKTEEISFEKGQLFIKTAFVKTVAKDMNSVEKVSSLEPELVKEYTELSAIAVRTVVTDYLIQKKPVWLLQDDDLPGLKRKEPSYIAKNKNAVWTDLSNAVKLPPLLPVSKLRKRTGLSDQGIEKRIQSGVIRASLIENEYFLSVDELRRIEQYARDYIALERPVYHLLSQTGNDSFHLQQKEQRNKLIDCFEQNNYWGLRVYRAETTPLSGGIFGLVIDVKDIDAFLRWAKLPVMCVGKPNEVCCQNILDTYQDRYPRTVGKLREFLADCHAYDEQRTVDMLDFLLCQLEMLGHELEELDENGVAQLVRAYLETTKTSGELFIQFLSYGGYTTREYKYDSIPGQSDRSAYPAGDFAVMVAYTVNEDLWERSGLLRKALQEKKNAELWLYIALHIFSAWRSTDYVRLEPPSLRYSWMETERRVANGTYTQEDAEYAARTFLGKIEVLQLHPNKTKAYRQVPPLLFHCPENCLAPFGMILSVAAVHYYRDGEQTEKAFVVARKDLRTIRNFFGEDMVKACGYRDFSGLRANKSVLQSVSSTALEDNQSPYLAYLLASLMRSHKGTYETLAQTTERYLQDANFAGEDPDYIIYQMFQRGVCSFAVDLLLKQCYGREYEVLPIQSKTECIVMLGVSNHQIDCIKKCIAEAQDHAIAVITEIAESEADIQPKRMLVSLANGHGYGKDRHSLCIAKAAELSCRFPDRQGCFGCRYEIKTKALLLRYLKNYDRLQTIERQADSEFERRKAAALRKTQFAEISEILYHLKTETSADEMRTYRALLADIQGRDKTDGSNRAKM